MSTFTCKNTYISLIMFPVTCLFFLIFLLLWSFLYLNHIENILWALHMKLFLNLFFSQFSS